jgi:hypothetical protein
MSVASLRRLPGELQDLIADYLAPLSRASFARYLTQDRHENEFPAWNKTSLSTKNKNSARIWDFIFKNDSWISKVLKLGNAHPQGGPLPCLVGSDLRKVSCGKSKGTYLVLLINDWEGDVQYIREAFFNSLQDYEVVEEGSVIRLKDSGILLHIADAIKSHEWVPMKDPRRVFRRSGRKLSTQAIYYTEDVVHEIDSSKIGGIEGFSWRKKKAVRDICSIKLKFRNGSPVYRVFENPERTVRVEPIKVRDENQKDWVASWRVVAR